jgi:hypothetical protein
VHSPESETARSRRLSPSLQAPSLSPHLPFEPLAAARPTPCPGHTDVVSIWDNGAEGSCLPAHLETFALLSWQPAIWRLGYAPCCRRHEHERWLRWKPPDVRERKQCSGNVVKMKNKKMSGLSCSPKPITALSPFTSKPATVTQALTPLHRDAATVHRPIPLLSVQPARCTEALSPPHLRWELGLVAVGSCLLRGKENDASASLIKIKKLSAVHSPRHYVALLLSAREPVASLRVPMMRQCIYDIIVRTEIERSAVHLPISKWARTV